MRELTSDEWSDVWIGAGTRTYFQSPQWNQAWESAFPGTYRAVCLRLEVGPQCVLHLPGCEHVRARGLEHGFRSVPGDGPAGFLNPPEEWSPHLPQLIKRIRQHYASVRMVQPDPTGQDDHAHQVDLTDGRVAEMFRRSRAAQYARQALSRGLTVVDGSGDGLVDELLPIYGRLRSHWTDRGLRHSVVPEVLVQAVVRQPGVRTAGVRHPDGRLLVGGLLLEAGHHVSSWFTFADPDYRKLRAQELYFSTMLERYRDNGYHTFDFVQSGGLAGVVQFKEKFGAEPHPLRQIHSRSVWSGWIDTFDRWRRP
jgi:CelD/BcsL family acetyltransferase involved in cellulose biosynthesis